MAGSHHRSSATPLALAYAALVLYASLHPFSGWRWPPGQDLWTLALLPWPRWRGEFDLWANLLGYLPLGLLLCVAARRSGSSRTAALVLALLLPAALSYATELLQQLLPRRHPSAKDWALNTGGAALGALLALAADVAGWLQRGQLLRQRWFVRDTRAAPVLLALWPLGLLFPTPVALGLGQIGGRLRAGLLDLLDDVPWAEPLAQWLAPPAAAQPAAPLPPLAEAAVIALGLLAPCLLACSAIAGKRRRVVTTLGALALAVAGMALSTAMNFGPEHALAWLGPAALPGLAAGTLLALAAVPLPRRLVTGLALVVLTALVAGVAQAPADPYFAQSLRAWEQGQWVHFHGLAQWVGWLWPYAAMVWLLARLARPRD